MKGGRYDRFEILPIVLSNLSANRPSKPRETDCSRCAILSSCSHARTGFAGWQDLTAEVSTRLGKGLEWAAAQARRIIHDNDVERLKKLLTEYPALLSWQGNDWDSNGGLLGNRHGRLR